MRLCLCGSTRFREQFLQLNLQLTLAGHVVYSVAAFHHSDHDFTPTDAQKVVLDLVHLEKVAASDAIVIATNEQGYVGASTKKEIMWAMARRKSIYWSNDRQAMDFLLVRCSERIALPLEGAP